MLHSGAFKFSHNLYERCNFVKANASCIRLLLLKYIKNVYMFTFHKQIGWK